MTVFTFPGQGAQKPGFLTPWLAEPAARERLEHLGEVAAVDLVRHGTESDADTIRDTALAQPLIVAAGILAWDALVATGTDLSQVAVAGHSVGEIAAAYAAGVFTADTAIAFVARRARLMAQAAAAADTGMAAVLGGDEQDVVARLGDLGLEPANYNGAGQIVAAGAQDALAELKANPPVKTRVIPLKVAGAFHTRYMAAAHDALAADTDTFTVADATRPLYTNRDGITISSGAEYLRLLIDQVNRPVRWDACMRAFAAAGHEILVEAPPAGTLVGLAKRALPDVVGLTVNTPEDIAVVAGQLARKDAQ